MAGGRCGTQYNDTRHNGTQNNAQVTKPNIIIFGTNTLFTAMLRVALPSAIMMIVEAPLPGPNVIKSITSVIYEYL